MRNAYIGIWGKGFLCFFGKTTTENFYASNRNREGTYLFSTITSDWLLLLDAGLSCRNSSELLFLNSLPLCPSCVSPFFPFFPKLEIDALEINLGDLLRSRESAEAKSVPLDKFNEEFRFKFGVNLIRLPFNERMANDSCNDWTSEESESIFEDDASRACWPYFDRSPCALRAL